MKTICPLLFFLFLIVAQVPAQDTTEFLIAFYNVENLFHPDDDSLKNDDAFTPTGFNHWTFKKYIRKVNNIAKVLIAMGRFQPPDIVGLAEIEEDRVLHRLCYESPLKKYGYHYIHYESPDARGVDVALLYRKNRIQILQHYPIPIIFPFDTTCKNRDVLYVKIHFLPPLDSVHPSDSTYAINQDLHPIEQLPDTTYVTYPELHIFINHWTSRYGGYAPTIIKRNYYAHIVRQYVDSILTRQPHAAILIMGDFNDYPTDESITDVLHAGDYNNKQHCDYQLFNLMNRFLKMENIGSHKHADFWGCLDQIIVSRALLNGHNPLSIFNGQAHIFKAPFMVELDPKYGGERVIRTFSGPRYIGGYADHLPVFVKLHIMNTAK